MSRGIKVLVADGRPEAVTGPVIEADMAVAIPSALAGLRPVLRALEAAAPASVKKVASDYPSEWNFIFPDSIAGAEPLSDLALTPSERRLHRESETMYRVLSTAAKAVLAATKETGSSLVLRNTGATDLVSLRGIMRAVEWSRLEESDGRRVILGDWGATPSHVAPTFALRRRGLFESLRERMRGTPMGSTAPANGHMNVVVKAVDLEEARLAIVLDPHAEAERRLAAAVLCVRSAFFSTSYEAALLACEVGLDLISRTGPGVSEDKVREHFAALDEGYNTPAAEIDASVLGGHECIASFLWRSIGVVRSFAGDFDGALEAFSRSVEFDVPPVMQASNHMYRGLMLAKRLGNTGEARKELLGAIASIEHMTDDVAMLEQGWLRNVTGLSFFAEKKLTEALEQEKLGMKCVGKLHDMKSTHLKINLISNVSVLLESAKQHDDAFKTWSRFAEISTRWDDNFHKHHKYRAAGLRLGAGDVTSAVTGYEEAFACAEKLRDTFHKQVISAELGRLWLDQGKAEVAASWFERAVEAAEVNGDPFRIAESRIGLAASTRGDLSGSASLALETTTYSTEAAKLLAAANTGDADRARQVLPKPKSKLNRPFDVVNLY